MGDHAEMLAFVIKEKDPEMNNAFTPEVADKIIRKEY